MKTQPIFINTLVLLFNLGLLFFLKTTGFILFINLLAVAISIYTILELLGFFEAIEGYIFGKDDEDFD